MNPAYLPPLANHLWQSTLFAGMAGLLTLLLRNNRARVRHWVWLVVSWKFLIPFSALVSLGDRIHWRAAPQTTQSSLSVAMDEISRPFTSAVSMESLPAGLPAASPIPALLWGSWACGFLGISCSWWIRWRRIRAAVRTGSPVHLEIPIRAVSSTLLLEPGVFGVFRPVVLLPEGILDRLTGTQLNGVIAHELCHVYHRDNLVAAIQMFVETVFWFHPLVWWIGKRMVQERERACDEEVLQLGGEPRVYAEGILNVCKFYVRSPLRCESRVTSGDLKKRIASIMNYRIPPRLTFARKLLLAAAGVAAVGGPVLAGILNAPQSRTQSKAERLTFEVASVKPADPNAGGNAPAGMPGARGGRGGPLLRAQIVLAQATKPQEPASLSTQRNPFEAIPEPPQPSLPKGSGPPIEAIEFRGTRVPQFALRAIIVSRVGGACDMETLRRDSQSLYNTGRFSDIHLETEPGPKGVIVRFVLVERPLIQSIEYQGDDTVTVSEIQERFKQRKVQLRAQTLYHEDELGLAAVTIQELVAERGRQNITVTPLVEPIQPSTVKIIFRGEKKE